MEEIKEVITQTLERKKVLAKLRAELRAQVFLAIEEQEQGNNGLGLGKKSSTPQREALLASPDGQVLFGLVHEFLHWCNLDFTIQVFEPEVGTTDNFLGRSQLNGQLGLVDTSNNDGPVLLSLVKKSLTAGTHLAGALPSPSAAGRLAPLPLAKPSGLEVQPATSNGKPDPTSSKSTLPQSNTSPSGIPTAPASTATTTTTASTAVATNNLSSGKAHSAAASSIPPPPTLTQKAAQGQAMPPPKVSVELSYDNDGEGFEIESDDELEGAVVVDDDEDYTSLLPPSKPSVATSASNLAAAAAAAKQPAQPAEAAPAPAPVAAAAAAVAAGAAAAKEEAEDLSDSDLSAASSSFPPGRIRKSKLQIPGRHSQDQELRLSHELASGDRSFEMSHELHGYNHMHGSGGLSISGEMPHSPDSEPKVSPNAGSRSGEVLAKPKLEPLAALSKPPGSKLGPLVPVGGPKTLLAPSQGRKAAVDVKEELRRAGLLTIPSDSFSDGPSSTRSTSGGGVAAAGAASAAGGAASAAGGAAGVANGRSRSAGGDGAEDGGADAAGPAGGAAGSGHGNAAAGMRAGTVRPVRGVYDAEFSVSNSMDMATEYVEDEELIINDGELGHDSHDLQVPLGISGRISKAVSLDMRETGLSASDRSGDLDHAFANADLAETAEWP